MQHLKSRTFHTVLAAQAALLITVHCTNLRAGGHAEVRETTARVAWDVTSMRPFKSIGLSRIRIIGLVESQRPSLVECRMQPDSF